MMDSTYPVIVGYSTKVRSPQTVMNHVLDPVPPGNIKKPETLQRWCRENIPDEREKFKKLAAWLKATGAIDRVIAIDLWGARLFDSGTLAYGPNSPSPGGYFVQWLLRYFAGAFAEGQLASKPSNDVVFYGFNPKPLLRLSGMNAIRDGIETPLRLWYLNDACFDPKEMLLETEAKKQVTLAKLIEECPGKDTPKMTPDYRPHVDPMEDARLATELCLRYQLIPTFNDSAMTALIDGGLFGGNTDESDDEAPEEKTERTQSKKTTKKKTAAAK